VSVLDDQAFESAFTDGNYHRVAASRHEKRWQTYAALGLCGNIAPALQGLAGFDSPEARFYEGVIHWIDGDEDAAARLLEQSDGEHAARLLALIRKRRINILSQLPWSQFGEGPHTVLNSARSSSKFEVRNIGSGPGDLRNAAGADIHDYYDRNQPPDFYLAEMIEWQLIPPNLQELTCPIIGHTADYDLHIHAVQPWLRMFDTVIVTDMTEFDDVSRLVDAPVVTFPKTFCLPRSLPPPPAPGERDIDVLMTGTTFHSYHREKAELLHQVIRVPGVRPFIMNGFLDWWLYHAMLKRTRLAISHIRHPGATPSRGIETLAMGTVLLAQPETTLRLWVGEDEGLVSYDLADKGLSHTIERVLADFPKYEQAAQRGMKIIRDEFDPDRLGAQYLRFATFLARPPKKRQNISPPAQKRLVAWQGWLQKDNAVYAALHEKALARLGEVPAEQLTYEDLNNPTREWMLGFVQRSLQTPVREARDMLAGTLEIYQLALQIRPLSLALRFNFIRAALHFGGESDIDQALGIARETLVAAPATWSLDPRDDVMTWDYCAAFFNYRAYFDLATASFAGEAVEEASLKDLILASIEYYCGRMTGDPAHFAAAAARDPEFSAYRLAYAKALLRSGEAEAAETAIKLLSALSKTSLYATEAWTLLQAIKQEHGISVPDEAETERAVHALATRTFLESDYDAIRNGAYFRSQRLGLARNEGYDVLKPAERPVKISVLLADLNGSIYPRLIAALQRQTMPRDDFEIVVVDAFDRIAPQVLEHADTVIALGQSEYLYNRNAAFNTAIERARGSLVALFDQDVVPEPQTLESLIAMFEGRGDDTLMAVNQDALPFDRRRPHFLALTRAQILQAGGLDESPFRAGGLGGPYELALRLQAHYADVRILDSVPAAMDERADAGSDIVPLLRDLWPYEFSPSRMLPRDESPAIRALREAL
jgi:hypothetical protein